VPLAEGPGWTALSEREDLAKYSDGNAIGLFAAELKLGINDIDTFAADALHDALPGIRSEVPGQSVPAYGQVQLGRDEGGAAHQLGHSENALEQERG
jgi:hypothetical protein